MNQDETKKILVVDDEENVRNVVSRIMTTEGYEAAGARDASEALKLFSIEQFDMVITDVKMPGDFTGIDLLRIIKAGFDVPVLMMSGHGTREMMLSSMRFGAADFIPKPFSHDHLVSIVANTFDVRSGAADCILPGDLPFTTGFEVARDYSVLEPLRLYIMQHSGLLGLGEMRAASLWLAVREAVTSVIRFTGGMEHVNEPIRVEFENKHKEIRVEVTDGGAGFDWRRTMDDIVETEESSMKGLSLIYSLTNDVSFSENWDAIQFIYLK